MSTRWVTRNNSKILKARSINFGMARARILIFRVTRPTAPILCPRPLYCLRSRSMTTWMQERVVGRMCRASHSTYHRACKAVRGATSYWWTSSHHRQTCFLRSTPLAIVRKLKRSSIPTFRLRVPLTTRTRRRTLYMRPRWLTRIREMVRFRVPCNRNSNCSLNRWLNRTSDRLRSLSKVPARWQMILTKMQSFLVETWWPKSDREKVKFSLRINKLMKTKSKKRQSSQTKLRPSLKAPSGILMSRLGVRCSLINLAWMILGSTKTLDTRPIIIIKLIIIFAIRWPLRSSSTVNIPSRGRCHRITRWEHQIQN